MDTERTLLILLFALVIILSLLLYQRIRSEKLRMAILDRTDPDQFSKFLNLNSSEGTIQNVARQVSKLLTESLACDVILFLRKKRNMMELNYYYGIRRFSRSDFRFSYNKKLFEQLKEDFRPRPVSELKDLLPVRLFEKLASSEVDLFFPIFWRENLYGIYFVRSSSETSSRIFNLLTASLAQSLSAAYHIKWHESRHDNLAKELEKNDKKPATAPIETNGVGKSMLRLVGHKNAETIVPKLISAIQNDLGIKHIALVYSGRDDKGEVLLYRTDANESVEAPPVSTFDEMLSMLRLKQSIKVESISSGSNETKRWMNDLQTGGYEYLSQFPLSSERPGFLVWSSDQPADAVSSKLRSLESHTANLISSAESYQIVEQMSFTDSLTGLANQRYFTRRLDEEVSRARRYGRKLTLVLFDLDQLKAVNDKYGHLSGDAVLKQMGEILRYTIRSIDIIARYGGDEFCIIMPEADQKTCLQFMDRLREEVSSARIELGSTEKIDYRCTISLGGAIFPDHAEQARELFDKADKALLKAKESGRNMGVIHT